MYNPYQNYQPIYQRQEIIKVNGEEGAKAYQLAPNSSVLLLDNNSPIVWLKMTDGAGYPTLSAYSITPYVKEEEKHMKSLEERITALEERLNESNITDVKQAKTNE